MEQEYFDLAKIKAPLIWKSTEEVGYSHPIAHFCNGKYYFFFTVVHKNNGDSYKTIAISTSTDLRRYTTPGMLQFGKESQLEEPQRKVELFNPSGLVEFQGNYYLCCESNKNLDGNCDIYLIKSKDLEEFEEPVPIDLPGNARGSFQKPYLIKDREQPGRVWCIYQDNGLVSAWTEDMKSWHFASRSTMTADEICVLAREDSYLLYTTREEGVFVWQTKSLETPIWKALGEQKPLSLYRNCHEWACGKLGCSCVVKDPITGYFLMLYWGAREASLPEDGTLALAFSADLLHWMTFTKDKATFPENGVIYDGDYYKALPFGEYLHQEPLPDGPIFDIRAYGAVADGVTLCTQAFMAAALAARDAGGGTVLISGGHYCVGTVRIYDNTTLFIAPDSALCASKDLSQYQDALLACVEAENVAIRGGGKIIGNGEYFVYLPLKRPLLESLPYIKLPPVLYDPMGYPVDSIRYAYRSRIRYAEDKYAQGLLPIQRPMYTVWIRSCKHVKIENIVIEGALDWTLDIDYSNFVTVKDIVIHGNRHVANTDGIDIMCSRNVEVHHCFVSCADDGICIKAPRKQGHDGMTISEASAKMGPAGEIHISDCTVLSVMNAFKIGTETYFDIENVTVENCKFLMPDIYPGSVSGISIESADGSNIRGICIRNIVMDKVCCPVFICLNQRNKDGYVDEEDRKQRCHGGSIQEVLIENIVADHVEVPSILTGFQTEDNKEQVVRRLENITIRNFKAVYEDSIEILDIKPNIYENQMDYPENNAFGDVPAYGFYLRHGKNIILENYEVIPRTMNTRQCVCQEDVIS